MKTFTFKDKTTLDFEEFPIKDENCRKIRTHIDGEYPEGIWAFFRDEDLKKYDDDSLVSEKYEAAVILANNALFAYPQASWGLYIPVKFKGSERPECNVGDMSGDMMFCKERLEQKDPDDGDTDGDGDDTKGA